MGQKGETDRIRTTITINSEKLYTDRQLPWGQTERVHIQPGPRAAVEQVYTALTCLALCPPGMQEGLVLRTRQRLAAPASATVTAGSVAYFRTGGPLTRLSPGRGKARRAAGGTEHEFHQPPLGALLLVQISFTTAWALPAEPRHC